MLFNIKSKNLKGFDKKNKIIKFLKIESAKIEN